MSLDPSPTTVPSPAPAADIRFHIVAEDEDFVVIDKMAGVSVHRDGEETGLVAEVAARLGLPRLYLVHRLDRITSGLLLLAKSAAACADLAALFAARAVEKYYVALTDRKPARKQGLVRGDMVRSRGGSWRLSRTCDNPAVTRFISCAAAPGLRLILLRPETGRTHQLRVALKSLGAPLLGDGRYGGTPADRGYLHAMALRFAWRGELRTFMSPPRTGEWFGHPAVVAALAAWSAPWQLPWPPARGRGGEGEGAPGG
jgi:tRNA pseudouridine32 synthase/23S rRNA pseudouridine746 synthase